GGGGGGRGVAEGAQGVDRARAPAAAEDIIRASNGRRPRGDTGESAIVRLEAAKKTGHLPVRQLLDQARHLAQAIKPCILTSPLAVSQYLPAGLTFDVVIFDEAGRISLADAINGIYRGGSGVPARGQN